LARWAIRITASCRQSKRHRNRKPNPRREGHRAAVIANTPRVVPTASTSRCEPVASTVWSRSERAAKKRNVAVTTRLLRIGANIGTENRRCAFSRPVATAPIP